MNICIMNLVLMPFLTRYVQAIEVDMLSSSSMYLEHYAIYFYTYIYIHHVSKMHIGLFSEVYITVHAFVVILYV